MPPAARVGDQALQAAPHCHAPIHPAAPVPTPLAHPALPLAIMPPGSPTVLIDMMPAARVSDLTAECILPTCVPNGPGTIAVGSPTILIDMLPAARAGDATLHATCVAPIPSPDGSILPPCSPTVMMDG